jgi:glycosyltransferase involved in cell wall biosynthesis
VNGNNLTALVITFNEEANLARCLEPLKWLERVVVLDSGSADRTLDICRQYPNVEIVQRSFDSFAGQCNFGLDQVQTEWVLSLDADYVLTDELVKEIQQLEALETASGFRAGFRYCMNGKSLKGTLYPPRAVLYRRSSARYEDDGHGHRVQIQGNVGELKGRILHDDRKPLKRWLESQRKYAVQEADKLLSPDAPKGGMADRLRRMIWPAVPTVFLYTYFLKGLIFDGWPGLFYTLQRVYAELLLSLELLDRKLAPKSLT